MTSPDPARPLSIHERLDLFYDRLRQAPAPSSADEALSRVNSTLDSVEDEYSGVPRNPDPPKEFDGRMYPPREDSITRGDDGSLMARTRGNRIAIGPDGATTISHARTGEVMYERLGAEAERAAELERAAAATERANEAAGNATERLDRLDRLDATDRDTADRERDGRDPTGPEQSAEPEPEQPDQAEPDQAEPDQAEPDQAEPDQAEPDPPAEDPEPTRDQEAER